MTHPVNSWLISFCKVLVNRVCRSVTKMPRVVAKETMKRTRILQTAKLVIDRATKV